jgi:ribosomal protein S27E
MFKKVCCPNCNRTISYYLEGSGTDSAYQNVCQRCGKTVLIYSAGKTVIVENIETTIIEINIKL